MWEDVIFVFHVEFSQDNTMFFNHIWGQGYSMCYHDQLKEKSRKLSVHRGIRSELNRRFSCATPVLGSLFIHSLTIYYMLIM